MFVQSDLQEKFKVGHGEKFRGKIMKTLLFSRGLSQRAAWNCPDQIHQTDEWPVVSLENFCPHVSDSVRE